MAIKSYTRRSVFTELAPYCHHAKPDDFMEVTRWANEEGFDVTIDDKTFSLTDGQFDCLMSLVNYKE